MKEKTPNLGKQNRICTQTNTFLYGPNERILGNDNVSLCCPQMEVNEADDEEEEEEEDEEELHFSAQDLVKIRDAVVLLVQSLLRLLQTFSLKDRPQSADNCTQVASGSIAPPSLRTTRCVSNVFVSSADL